MPLRPKSWLFVVALLCLASPSVFGQSFSIVNSVPASTPVGTAALVVNVSVSVTNFPGNSTGSNNLYVAYDGLPYSVLGNVAAIAPPFDIPDGFQNIVLNVPASVMAYAHTATIYILIRFFPSMGNTVDVVKTISFPVFGAPSNLTLSPTSIPPGGTGFTLTVTGNSIQPGATVFWNDGTGNPATPLSTSSNGTTLTALVPGTLLATPGVVLITAQNPGVNTPSPAVPFVIGAQPLINPGGESPSGATPGGPDFVLTINGSSFQTTSVVQWNGTSIPTSFVSANQLTAIVSAGLIKTAGSASIQVVNPGNLASNTVTFTIALVPAPTINPSGLTPGGALAGTASQAITIAGTGFASGATLQWVGATTQTLTTSFSSASLLTATVPGNLLTTAGSASVSVVNPNGAASNTVTFTVGNPPAISASGGVSPATVAAGSGGFQITVQGANFVTGSVVRWDDGSGPSATNPTKLSTQFVSSTQLSAAVPSSLVGAPVTAAITVLNPDGSISNAALVTVGTPTTISAGGLTPMFAIAGGSAFNLTVTGSNFTTGSVVQWNAGAGIQPLSTGLIDSTHLSAIVPAALIASPGAALVSVLSASGSQSASVAFTIQAPAPVISSSGGLVPATSPTGSSTQQLTVNGANFQNGAIVQWNPGSGNVALVTGYVSASQLTAVLPATPELATAVTAIVTVKNPDLSLSNPVLFTVGNAPAINPGTLNPPTTTAGGPSFTLIINGTNFQSGSQARWNPGTGPQNIATGFVNSTQLNAVVPASLITSVGSALITVLNTDGTVSNAEPFQITPVVPVIPAVSQVDLTQISAGNGAFTITLTGTNFTNGSVVQWNSGSSVQNLATGVATVSGSVITQLTALIPAALVTNPGVALIGVSNSGGPESNTTTFTINAAGGASLPAIKVPGGLGLVSTTAGGAAFTLTVTGTNFTNNSVVQWNTGAAVQTLSTGYVTDQTGKVVALTAVVTANLIANVGVALITVSNPGNAVSNAVEFDVTAGVPQISGFVPSNINPVAGSSSFQLGVTGTGFVSGSIVRWDNGAGPQSLTTGFVAGGTQLTSLVPASLIASPGTAFVTVANPGGTVSNTLSITISPPANNVPPVITSLDPLSESANFGAFQLIINGSGFINGAVAQWNAGATSQALTTGFTSGIKLIALVPASLLSAPGPVFISVTNPGGSVSNTQVFTINPQSGSAPAIATSNGLTPSAATVGGVGFQLQVSGNNFQNGSIVQWNSGSGPTALQTGFVSVSQLNALVPSSLLTAPGIAFVTVLNPGGTTSNAVSFTIGGAVAAVTALTPNSTAAGTSGLQVTITGTNFTTGSTVSWGGTTLPATISSPTQMSVVVPGNLLAAQGQTVVTVQNSSGTSNAVTFSVNPPTLTGISPTTATAGGAAFTLTVTGTNFVGGAAVVWSGTNLSTTVVSATQVTAQVSAGLITTSGPVNVTVINPGGASTSALSFIVNPPNAPTPSGLTPASAVAGGQSFQLTVAGTGFMSGAQVLWDGAALFTTVASATQLTALVDSSLVAMPGTATVVVQNPGSPLSTALKFLVNGPTITSLNPTTVSAGAPGFTLSVTGTNFLAGSAVVWNGISLPTAFANSTQLSAPVPPADVASAGTVSVTVQNPGGATSAASTFTIGPFTLVITTATLPDAIVGQAYSQILQATGGTAPYTWSVSGGALPAGLSLDPNSGTLSGTATAANTASVGITVTDSVGRTLAKTLILHSVLALSVTTTSPLTTILTSSNPYTFSLQGTGGTPPYTWTAAGSLPPGIALGSSSGQLTGVPNTAGSYQFTITLTDSRQQSTSAVLGWTILPVPLGLAITGLTNPAQPAQQPGISISLTNPYPADITGTISLSITSAVGVDDPNIQFSTGGRQVQYTIPAGSTTASVFQAPPPAASTSGTPTTTTVPPQTALSLLTGTVAGTITLSATATSSGSTITPSPAPVLTAQVPKLAPVLTRVGLSAVTGGVSVAISGYSTTREIVQGTLQFTAAQGSSLNNATITVPLTSLFSTWYQNSASLVFGSQFVVAIPIAVQGSTGVVTGVTVTLTNGVGASAPTSATLQ